MGYKYSIWLVNMLLFVYQILINITLIDHFFKVYAPFYLY